MPDDPRAKIATELGVSDAPWTAQLSDAHAAQLLAVIQASRARQATALRAAIEEALTHIPWLFRGALRKVLFS